jgi:hypothetical protein
MATNSSTLTFVQLILAIILVGNNLSRAPITFHGKTGTVNDLTFFSINRAIMAAPFSTGITKGRLDSMVLRGVSINPGCNSVTSFFSR